MTPAAGSDPEVAVEWADLRDRLARTRALAAAAAEAKASLARRLDAALEVRREWLRQNAELDEMERKLEARKRAMKDVVVSEKRALERVEWRKEQLMLQIRRLLPLSKALAAAHQEVEKSKELLSGEEGHARLQTLQKLLRMRQQYMIAQVSALYPVKTFNDQSPAENFNTQTPDPRTISGDNGAPLLDVLKSQQVPSLTFFGLRLTNHTQKQKNYKDKELQRSATVLGYAAHAVSLMALYLDVPLRYPLHYGGSRSYVSDCLPSAESTSPDMAEGPSVMSTNSKLTAFPLFLECPEDDSTRASYAVYLLHKDTEQILNYIGAEGTGSRHVFANLKALSRIIQSNEYVYR